MKKALEDVNNILSATLDTQFEILFVKTLGEAEMYFDRPKVIAFDAIDECGTSETRRALLRVLSRLPELPKKFRFLITTRPENDITNTLFHLPTMIQLELDPSSSDSQHDVQAYLKHAMRDAFTSEERARVSAWEDDMDLLGNAANGVFIWASTAEKFVSEADDKPRCLRDLVADVKTGGLSLYALYARVLRGSFEWDQKATSDFTRVMVLVLLGKEPFTAKMIDGMLGLKSDGILSRLGPVLLRIAGQPIRLRHTSLYDYFTSCKGEPWFVDADDGRLILAHLSFDGMADRLHFNMGRIKSSFYPNDRVGQRAPGAITADVRYICRYWAQHLREVPFSIDLLRRLSTFTLEQLLFWFEVLSLTKDFYHIPGGCLREAISWIPVSVIQSSLWGRF